MTPLAVTLVTISAFIHALWNLLGKRQNPSTAFFFLAAVFASLCFSPLLLVYHQAFAYIPGRVWLWVGLTSFFEAIYFIGLAGAYRHGDMSVAYPLARAIPVVLVALITTIFSLGKPLSLIGIAGILLVVLGCLLLPLRNLRQVRLQEYLTACCLLAGLAGLGTTGYTLVDNQALQDLGSVAGIGLVKIEVAFFYLALGSVAIALALGVSVLASRVEREALKRTWREGKGMALLTGFLIIDTYGLVLTAMEYSNNVSYIAAFRQLSIPIGAILGIAIQKEAAYPTKLASIAIIFAGLVLIVLV
jgi:multidrug transporter EmrE-like cation transporter